MHFVHAMRPNATGTNICIRKPLIYIHVIKRLSHCAAAATVTYCNIGLIFRKKANTTSFQLLTSDMLSWSMRAE